LGGVNDKTKRKRKKKKAKLFGTGAKKKQKIVGPANGREQTSKREVQ